MRFYSTDRKPIAEDLRTLPGDYGALPSRCCPPVCRRSVRRCPAISADRSCGLSKSRGGPVVTPSAPAGPSAEEQAAAAERERLWPAAGLVDFEIRFFQPYRRFPCNDECSAESSSLRR